MKKIMFVTRFLSGGGAERVVSVFANALAGMGIDVCVLVFNETENEYYLMSDVHRLSIGNYSEGSGTRVGRTWKRFTCIRRVLKMEKPDIIIPFLDTALRETFFASRRLNCTIIATVRNMPVFDNKMSEKFYMWIYGRCDGIFFQTESQRKFLENCSYKNSFVLPNPISNQFFKIGSKREKVNVVKNFVSVGRLNPQKNHELLIKAFEHVHQKYNETRLYIYGTGSDRTQLEKLIGKIGAGEYIFLCGSTNQVDKVYEKMDAFVLSSDYEGMPNALMEAMASGLPCISTDCPTGPKELLGDNDRGLLVPVNDDKRLAKAIIMYIEQPDYACKMGANAYTYMCEKFNQEHIAKQLMEHCDVLSKG